MNGNVVLDRIKHKNGSFIKLINCQSVKIKNCVFLENSFNNTDVGGCLNLIVLFFILEIT